MSKITRQYAAEFKKLCMMCEHRNDGSGIHPAMNKAENSKMRFKMKPMDIRATVTDKKHVKIIRVKAGRNVQSLRIASPREAIYCNFSGEVLDLVAFKISRYFALELGEDADIPCPAFNKLKESFDREVGQTPVSLIYDRYRKQQTSSRFYTGSAQRESEEEEE